MSAGGFARAARLAVAACLALLLAGCGEGAAPSREGRGGGPYRMTLATAPAAPQAGQPAELTWQLTYASSGAPLHDLQVMHERVIHNFIVKRDFTSFVHIHHEDFRALSDDDLARATFTLPYTFPSTGQYRVVSEFAHGDRSWSKHFDVDVGGAPVPAPPPANLARVRQIGPYTATLHVSPDPVVAGYESELVIEIARDGVPVTDLALRLGAEVHLAIWREDGSAFGHTHSYTPRMASLVESMHDRTLDDFTRARRLADLMVKLMCMPAELVYRGPRVPLRYVFPEPGTYRLFFETAPGGTEQVFDFALEVKPYADGMNTSLDSMLVRGAAP